MPLRFHNTLTQRVEPFTPLADNTVRMYTCGPTVYDYAHIGNFRTFAFVDLLRRWLRASGFELDHVMNITDVDDKIIRNAVAQHSRSRSTRRVYTQAFLRRLPVAAPGSVRSAWSRPPSISTDMVQRHRATRRGRPHLLQRRIRLFPDLDFSGVRQALA